MTVNNIHEAKTNFSKLIKPVLNGEGVVIAKAGKPLVRILPFEAGDFSPRLPGFDKGKIGRMPDFDEPLSEFEI